MHKERQIGKKKSKVKRSYLVKWLGYGDELNSWEPEAFAWCLARLLTSSQQASLNNNLALLVNRRVDWQKPRCIVGHDFLSHFLS